MMKKLKKWFEYKLYRLAVRFVNYYENNHIIIDDDVEVEIPLTWKGN